MSKNALHYFIDLDNIISHFLSHTLGLQQCIVCYIKKYFGRLFMVIIQIPPVVVWLDGCSILKQASF